MIKLTGAANNNSTNPYEAKASILVTKYPKRQIFPNIKESQKDIFPTVIISLFFIFKILSLS